MAKGPVRKKVKSGMDAFISKMKAVKKYRKSLWEQRVKRWSAGNKSCPCFGL